jgi:hypothetical protein
MLLIVLIAGSLGGAVAAQGDTDVAVTRELKNMAGRWKEVSRVRDG